MASSLLNVGQEAGGSIGPATLGTVAWSVVADTGRSSAVVTARAAAHVPPGKKAALRTQAYHHALATGFSRSFLVSVTVMALALVITLIAIRVTRRDLTA